MNYLFYRLDSNIKSNNQEKKILIDKRFNALLWKPTTLEIVPKRIALLPFGVWWVMHYLHMFTNKDYGQYLIYDRNNLVHRSVITPRYFRFLFMEKDDLQLGDIWTMPEYRGKGLASFAIQNIVKLHNKPNRRFWYVVEEHNIPSIRAVENAGFKKVGEGFRKKRMGMRILGSFEIENQF